MRSDPSLHDHAVVFTRPQPSASSITAQIVSLLQPFDLKERAAVLKEAKRRLGLQVEARGRELDITAAIRAALPTRETWNVHFAMVACDAAGVIDASKEHIAMSLVHLCRKGILRRVKRGLYEVAK